MLLLIDGYNLLHVTDLLGADELAGTLRGSREALVGFLAGRLTEKERRATVIVFDAAEAPPGLPDRVDHAGIAIRFARGYPDADSMIEALLDDVHGAKQLTVVSGDRRVQRAARSSGARWADSATWFAELCRRPIETREYRAEKPASSAGTNQQWVEEFSEPSALEAIEREAAEAPLPARRPAVQATPDGTTPAKPFDASKPKPAKKKRRRPPLSESSAKADDKFGQGVFDPFPPGYADDLLGSDSSEEDSDKKR